MFVWLFHRISGILLFILIGLQIVTGYVLNGELKSPWEKAFASVHRIQAINLLILFLFIFHALYGLRTILIDLGIKKEKYLFWFFTILGVLVFCGSAYFIITKVPVKTT